MKYAVVVVALVLLAYLVMDFNARTAELNRLQAERAVVQAQLESHQQTKAALEAEIAYATSDAAVYQWAYENHRARSGDFVIVPVDALQSTPTLTPRPVITVTQVSNLERWFSLFVEVTPATK